MNYWDIVYVKRSGNDFKFAVYPSDAKPRWIHKELSKLGEVTKIRATLADNDSSLVLVTVNFATQPKLRPRVKEATVFDSGIAATNANVEDAVSLGQEEAGAAPAGIVTNNEQCEKMDVRSTKREFFSSQPRNARRSHFFAILTNLNGWTIYIRQKHETATNDLVMHNT